MAFGRSRSPRSTCLPGRLNAPILPLLALAALLGGPISPAAAQPGCMPQAVTLDTTSHQVGRLTSMGNGLARTAYQYDTLGRPVRTAYSQDGSTWVFSSTFGYPQNPGTTPGPGTVLRSETFPDGEVATYGYDTAGVRQTLTATRPGQSAQPILTAMQRNAREQTTQVSFGNGTVSTRSYNDTTDLRLREIATSAGATTLQRLAYGYDGDGNVLSVSEAVVPGYSATYGYDSLDQLISMGGSVTGAYGYDAAGNLVTKDGVLQTYGGTGRGPHALAAAGPAVYTYDDNGNVIATSTGLALTWSAENQVIRATQASVEQNRKSYVGDRLWKKVEGALTTYYMPSLRVEGGACRKFYGGFAERSPDGTLEFYHPDHLGSSTVVTNSAQQVSHRIAYLPWGEDRGVAGGSFQPRYQFNFKEKESTGLYDYGARLYNPATGRWMSADLVTADGPNRYAYVSNNPLLFVDPTGHAQQQSEAAIHVEARDNAYRQIKDLIEGQMFMILAKGIRNPTNDRGVARDISRALSFDLDRVADIPNANDWPEAARAVARYKPVESWMLITSRYLQRFSGENLILSSHSNGLQIMRQGLKILTNRGWNIQPAAVVIFSPNARNMDDIREVLAMTGKAPVIFVVGRWDHFRRWFVPDAVELRDAFSAEQRSRITILQVPSGHTVADLTGTLIRGAATTTGPGVRATGVQTLMVNGQTEFVEKRP